MLLAETIMNKEKEYYSKGVLAIIIKRRAIVDMIRRLTVIELGLQLLSLLNSTSISSRAMKVSNSTICPVFRSIA